MTQKAIGPSFSDELTAYGGLIGHRFTWSPDGTIEFFEDTPQPVIDGVLAVYEAHDPDVPSHASLIVQARLELDSSDVTIIRCFENSKPVPADWVVYRKTLRAILGGAVKVMPPKPPYPAGT